MAEYLVTADRYFGDSPGGAYRVAWELALLGARSGHHTTLLCGSTYADPPTGPVEIQGVRVVRYRFPRTSPLDPFRWKRHLASAAARLQDEQPDGRWDVIHAHNLVGALVAFARASSSARLIYTVHSPAIVEQAINWRNGTIAGRMKLWFGMPTLARQEREVLSRAQRLHVLSEYTRSEVAHHYGEAIAAKAKRIPWWAPVQRNGPSKEEARRRLGWPQDVPVLLTVRRMVRRMGLDVVLDALEPLAGTHSFQAVLAGTGPERERLMERVRRGPLEGRVLFPGRVSEEELELAYRATDLFLLPTTALECFGLIVLESLARGVPVLATDAGAIPELLAPILPDWLVKAGEVKQLSDKLRAFLEKQLVPPTPEALVSHVAAHFDRRRLEEEYLEFVFGGLGQHERYQNGRPALEPTSLAGNEHSIVKERIDG